MTRPQLTGPDYLIGAAEHLASSVPWARAFSDMVKQALRPSTVPGLAWSRPSEWAAKRDLKGHEEAAVQVFAEAFRVALARRDRKSLAELAGWGAAMLIRFEAYVEQRNEAERDREDRARGVSGIEND